MTTDHERTTLAPAGAGVVSRRGRRLLLHLGAAVLVVMLLRAFVIESFYVPSASMSPTIRAGDRVVVAKTATGDLRPGDVIVFDGTGTMAPADRSPYMSDGLLGRTLSGLASAVGVSLGEHDYLKRVAAVGGQRLSCTPEAGLVRDGERVTEDYLAEDEQACSSPFDVVVPQGRIFVLGDHRSDSLDSRSRLGAPGGGMIPVDDVVGEVVLRYWPLPRAGVL
ncbi:signal peptidase I [Marihabitans asiaticum]|uniref:Signal peptidase I n=1 Tax=Marihabitans asiaticum TaxID=415218 RepID=A0A560W9M8_9MICO|nr:signal peptidase I [Marihabitans asiaticum]TWD14333.1 signal peptidase I [Marihabitans asiaticum]